jgi:hypothetical protein
VLLDDAQHRRQMADEALELGLVLAHQGRGLGGDLFGVHDERAQLGAVVGEPLHHRRQVVDEGAQLLVVSGHGGRQRVGRADEVTHLPGAGVDGAGETVEPVDDGGHLGLLALGDGLQGSEHLVERLHVAVLEEVAGGLLQVLELHRNRGVGDHRPRPQGMVPSRSGLQCYVEHPEQRLDLDGGRGLTGQHHTVVDGKVGHHRVAVDAHAAHRAHPHAGDRHRRAPADPRGVGEARLNGVRRHEDRAVEEQNAQHQRDRHGDGDDPDEAGVSLGEGLHDALPDPVPATAWRNPPMPADPPGPDDPAGPGKPEEGGLPKGPDPAGALPLS